MAASVLVCNADVKANVYIPMRGAIWREATHRTNDDYLTRHIYPVFGHVRLKEITKFQVQMFLNDIAQKVYSYTVVYHARDLIKAAFAEAVDQDVLERNVAKRSFLRSRSARNTYYP
jgi:hypothetical protein